MLTRNAAPRVAAEPAGAPRDRAFDAALDVLRERRDEFNAQHYVPADYVHLLKKAGMYRAATPTEFGGEPMAPSTFMKLVERISAVDPATGWVSSFGSSLIYLAALPVESQRDIYADGP